MAMPDQPAWPDAPELLPPGQMPKRRKAGSERFASLRAALALTESPASTKHWSLLRLPPARKPTVPAPAAGR